MLRALLLSAALLAIMLPPANKRLSYLLPASAEAEAPPLSDMNLALPLLLLSLVYGRPGADKPALLQLLAPCYILYAIPYVFLQGPCCRAWSLAHPLRALGLVNGRSGADYITAISAP